MRISTKGMHAIRALLSMRVKPSPDASWYSVVRQYAWDDGEVIKLARPFTPVRNTEGATVTAEVSIHDEIGMWGITAKDLVADIKAIKDVDVISLRINSPGGEVHDGVAIYNALREHPARVEVTVDGLAASAASFIAMAGDHVRMPRASQMMIHRASGCAIGDRDDAAKTSDILRLQDDTIAGIYSEKTGIAEEAWQVAMAEEMWYSADEAVEAGLADEVFDYPRAESKAGDEEEGTVDTADPFKALERWGMTAVTNEVLVALAKEAGFTVDLEAKTLTVAEDPATVATDNAEDSTKEPTAVKVDNADDPTDGLASTEELAARVQVYEYLSI